MPQSPLERWQSPPKYYAELVDRARKHDPKIIGGAASSAEIARLEKDGIRRGALEGSAQ
jgi:hypothetical protein